MRTRKATLRDAEGIAKVHVDSWRSTYHGILPEELLNNLTYKQRTELWQKNLSLEDHYVFVTEDEIGNIVGFATGGKRDANQFDHSGDLTAIYILKDFQGLGIGKKLLNEVFSQFEELEYHLIFVEVLKDNPSRNFYEFMGAVLHSHNQVTVGGSSQTLLIYKWEDIREVHLI